MRISDWSSDVCSSDLTFDVQGQYSGSAGRHRSVVGGGVRTTRDEFVNDLNPFVIVPERKRLWVMNIFAQDEMQLGDDLALTAGVKLDRSSFSGLEILPNLRVRSEEHTCELQSLMRNSFAVFCLKQ